MYCAGGERERRRLRDRASSRGESGESGGVGWAWGASHGAAWYWGGASPHPFADLQCKGVAAVAAGGTGRVAVPVGGRLGGPLRRGAVGRADTVLGMGGGRPLVVGGVVGWIARWVVLPSHALVLFLHVGFWPGGVGLVGSGTGGGGGGGG